MATLTAPLMIKLNSKSRGLARKVLFVVSWNGKVIHEISLDPGNGLAISRALRAYLEIVLNST